MAEPVNGNVGVTGPPPPPPEPTALITYQSPPEACKVTQGAEPLSPDTPAELIGIVFTPLPTNNLGLN